ncbi:UBX domain-containing protein 7 [Spathaspora sp. JA1]|nr:UBX domain-containing protein 7 [Spathaspora sp. JA1]
MSQYLDSLFSTSVQESVQATVSLNKPLFVYLYRDSRSECDNFLDKFIDENITNNILKDNFVLLKLQESTQEYDQFNQVFPNLVIPSFSIIWRGTIVGAITVDKSKDYFQRLIETISENLGGKSSTGQAGVSSIPPSVSAPVVGGISRPTEPTKIKEAHDISVAKHKLQVDQIRKDQLEEKKRLRELLKSDQRERELRQQELEKELHREISPSTSPEEIKHKTELGMCLLSIKLFDGSPIKHEFKSDNTLVDVRTWLDSEVGIIPSHEDMPGFVAKNSYPHPINYVFHRPSLPRITYTQEQETETLLQLELTPRSALILKPIYHEDDSTNDGDTQNVGYIRSAFRLIGSLGGALFSFFDYGTGAEGNEGELRNPSEQQQQVNLPLVDDIQQIGLGHTIVSLDDGRSPSSSGSQSSSMFNIEHPNVKSTRENNFPSTMSRPESPTLDSNRPTSGYPSRSNTPRPGERVNRIQMFQEEDKGVDTYNGNSVNLNERDDTENN